MTDFATYLDKQTGNQQITRNAEIVKPTEVTASDSLSEADIKRAVQMLGRQGGNKTLEKHGTAHFSHAGKIGAEKRWGKRQEASK